MNTKDLSLTDDDTIPSGSKRECSTCHIFYEIQKGCKYCGGFDAVLQKILGSITYLQIMGDGEAATDRVEVQPQMRRTHYLWEHTWKRFGAKAGVSYSVALFAGDEKIHETKIDAMINHVHAKIRWYV